MIRLLSIGWVALGWMVSCSSAVKPVARAPASAATPETQDSPEKVVLDLVDGVKMEFVRIKAGKFMMGSGQNDWEKPVHEVTLTKEYWMQTTETTQAQWKAVMGNNPSRIKGDDLPVESVKWEDCQEFMKKLNEKAKEQMKGKKATLPTEAEWEYACRAGEKGDDDYGRGEYGWFYNNADKTHAVGQKNANGWGLYDMHGNVSEWCEDWYGKYPSEAVTDPTGPAKGDFRCNRGGSCYDDCVNRDTRSASRWWCAHTVHPSQVGLRVALR